jgi:two-component sensor histidine kinase
VPYGAEVRGPIRVLYIDDDPALAVLMQKALTRRGHHVTHVLTGEEGLAALAQGDIDVIALDHTLPGETGLAVLAQLGTRSERPPVVYVTGSADARLAVQAIKAGADDYVVKEVSGEFFELVIAAIEQVLERWRFRQQKERNERAVREARDRAELLLREVNHRVANSLGLVAGMVRMQASLLKDPAAVQALNETQARIAAIAGVHRRLYASDTIGLVEIDDYLGHFLNDLETSLAGPDRPYTVRLSSERIAVPTDKAVSLGVIVGELVTNAFKYAYPPGVAGEIRVEAHSAGGSAHVTVEDDGQGFDPTAAPTGTGLGTRILAAMAINLQADIRFEPRSNGARVVVDFPLAG